MTAPCAASVASPDPLAPPGSRADLAATLLVLALAALLVLPWLGGRVITTSHEARFAVLAQDMLRRHAWLDARVGGEVYRNKPPLFPWAIAALSALEGRVSEASARAPVAIAAIATVVLTGALGRRLFGRRAGLWAALVLLTTYDFFAHSQLIQPDMLVTAFVAAAAWVFWRAMTVEGARAAMTVFYLAVAGAVFSKGPVGLLPVLVAVVWLWSEAGLRGLRRLWSPVGLGVFGLVTVAWLGPFLVLGPGTFARGVLREDWLDWFVGVPSPRELSAYVVECILGVLPWTFVLPLALVAAARAGSRSSGALRFVLIWLAAPVVLVTVSGNPRARYVLPVLPAAAMLIGWWADARASVPTRVDRAVGVIALLTAAAAIATALSLGSAAVLLASAPTGPLLGGFLGVCVAAASVGVGLCTGRRRLLVSGGVAGACAALACGSVLYTDQVNRTHDFRRVGEALALHAPDREPTAYFNRRYYQIDFYFEREVRQIRTVQEFNAYMAQPAGSVTLVNARNWEFIGPHRSPELRVLARLPAGEEELLVVGRAPLTLTATAAPERR
jgi:4-amino-4-deoxy-L-arabinose transferase-like glycosyltransferase